MHRTKKQHYVPQSYLARFTEEATKDGRFHVYDFEAKKCRPGSPRKVACETDLYLWDRIDSDIGPQDIEDMFEKTERIASTQIARIELERALPAETSEMGALLTWIAIQHHRVPNRRLARSRYYDDTARILLELACANEQRYESTIKRIERESGEPMEGVTREEMLKFISETTFGVDNATHMKDMLDGIDTLREPLYRRKWTLLIAPSGVPDFITSDNPVSLVPTQRIVEAVKGFGFGFGTPGTIVFYPLTPRLAMCGSLGPGVNGGAKVVDGKMLAEVNTATAVSAARCVFSRRRRIYFARNKLTELCSANGRLDTLLAERQDARPRERESAAESIAQPETQLAHVAHQ